MGIYNFKSRFVPFIEDGSKTHTIREKRRYPDKAGDVLHLYTGLRQRGARLLMRRRCVRVEDIRITKQKAVYIRRVKLTSDERNLLAWRDGFRMNGVAGAFDEMMAFWNGRLPFHGDLIHWQTLPPELVTAVLYDNNPLPGNPSLGLFRNPERRCPKRKKATA